MFHIHSLGFVLLYGAAAEVVVPYLCHEADVAPQTGCCYSLIGSLSAGVHEEIASDDCFARKWQPFHVYDHVGVAAAYYNYSFAHNIFILVHRCFEQGRREDCSPAG
jgi:hypothetical protein